MRKRKKYCLTFIACLYLGIAITPVSAHYDTAYWNETRVSGDNSKWMSQLPDSTRISEMSIPGTHDTMAHKANLLGADNARTQSMTLPQQLYSGIRYIDIRAKYKNTYFQINHGITDTGYTFNDVMLSLRQYLKENPSETIFMRFKQEDSSASDDQMKKLFSQYYNEYESIFWKPKQSENSQNPQLRELRGKVVLVSDVLSITEGLNYRNIRTQDNYHLNTNWDLYTKWNRVKDQLNTANNQSSNNTIYMNYLSGSGGSMPYFVASGHSSPGTGDARLATGLTEPGFHYRYPDFPRVNWFGTFATIAFEGTNTLTANWIERNKPKYVGFIVADFPGERLINNIIRTNFGKLSGEYKLNLKSFPNYVVDYHLEDQNITMWNKNNGINQSWVLEYDHNVRAYKIRSKVDYNTILAWNAYRGSNNVFATQDQSKSEHYWLLEEKNGGYIIRNYRDQNLILTIAEPKRPYDDLNLIVHEKYTNDQFNIFRLDPL